MNYYFLDSSALVKRYVIEAGTAWVRALTRHHSGQIIIIAHITQAEMVSGAMRRKREGTMPARTARAVRLLIDRHAQRAYRVVRLTRAIIRHAEDLLEVHPLRTYDAIQLASALESHTRLVTVGLSPLIFVSADARLLTAARTEGLTTDNPNVHT